MTKEEFDALGITERDLVCVYILSFPFKFAPEKILQKLVGNIVNNDQRICAQFGGVYSHAEGNTPLMRICARYNAKFNQFYPADHVYLSEIKSIEILKKDFWHE